MPPDQKPDVKKFIEDPAFQGDRELFDGYLEYSLTKRAGEVKARKESGAAPVGIFDALFGWGGKSADDERASIFDVPFLPKKPR